VSAQDFCKLRPVGPERKVFVHLAEGQSVVCRRLLALVIVLAAALCARAAGAEILIATAGPMTGPTA
jgi:hypothetical protein